MRLNQAANAGNLSRYGYKLVEMRPIRSTLLVALSLSIASMAWSTAANPTQADEIYLRNGVKLSGTLVSETERDGDAIYEFVTEDGVQMTMHARSVVRVKVDPSELATYYEQREAMEDTIDAHIALADYCDEHRLARELKNYHLWQVIRHDFDHEEARRRLGYAVLGGRWQTQDEFMYSQGYVRGDDRRWLLPMEAELASVREARDEEVIEWRQKLRHWSDWLGNRQHDEALVNIRAIRAPAAVGPISDLLLEAETRQAKQLWIDALEQIGTPSIGTAIRQIALYDDDDNMRDRCVRVLKELNQPGNVHFFLSHLNPAENPPVIINRAAAALEELATERAVRSLIEALITEHQQQVGGSNGGGGGQNINFSAGGPNGGLGGLTMNEKPQVITIRSQNPSVLACLATLTGQNFQYDKDAWMRWYVEQNSYPNVNLRRIDD